MKHTVHVFSLTTLAETVETCPSGKVAALRTLLHHMIATEALQNNNAKAHYACAELKRQTYVSDTAPQRTSIAFKEEVAEEFALMCEHYKKAAIQEHPEAKIFCELWINKGRFLCPQCRDVGYCMVGPYCSVTCCTQRETLRPLPLKRTQRADDICKIFYLLHPRVV